ncbi:MAG: SpoIIE family protein phosphatase [Acidobacteria bacterium]|nr:SpoIIE family protein phosphatase [Acidobacteriota bacterium]
MRFPFKTAEPVRATRQPERATIPQMVGASVGAEYRPIRVGGDFYDFVQVSAARIVLVLLDIAGKREPAMDVAAAVQDAFRLKAAELFSGGSCNHSESLALLFIELNRALRAASGGVRYCPGFIASYEAELGTLYYVNAGHHPGLIRDSGGLTLLESTGLPLGLFHHATHEAQVSVLSPGASFVVVSRGVVEAKARREEFGMDRLRESYGALQFGDAKELCAGLLDALKKFTGGAIPANDMTVVALVRT